MISPAGPGIDVTVQRMPVLPAATRPWLRPDQIADRHRRAAKAFGYLLTAANPRLWIAGAYVWEARLTPDERRDLALSVGLSLDPDAFADVAVQVLGAADHPLPSFLDPVDEARLWAELANVAERRAYVMACFLALSPSDRAAFLDTAAATMRGQRTGAA